MATVNFRRSNVNGECVVAFTTEDLSKIGGDLVSPNGLEKLIDKMNKDLDDDMENIFDKYDELSSYGIDNKILKISLETGYYDGIAIIFNVYENINKDGIFDTRTLDNIYSGMDDIKRGFLSEIVFNEDNQLDLNNAYNLSEYDKTKIVNDYCKEKYSLSYNDIKNKIYGEIFKVVDKYDYLIQKTGEVLGGHLEYPGWLNKVESIKLNPVPNYDEIFYNDYLDIYENNSLDDLDYSRDIINTSYQHDSTEFILHNIIPIVDRLNDDIVKIKQIINKNITNSNLKDMIYNQDYKAIHNSYIANIIDFDEIMYDYSKDYNVDHYIDNKLTPIILEELTISIIDNLTGDSETFDDLYNIDNIDDYIKTLNNIVDMLDKETYDEKYII